MDIPANSWISGKKYKTDDIVRVGNFSEQIAGVTISTDEEIAAGGLFPIDPKLDYSVSALVKKGSKDSRTVDPFKTFIKQKLDSGNYIIDPENSIGVGVGIQFYNSAGNDLGVSNLRNTHRLMGSSELSDTEYYNVQLDIENTSIPTAATQASVVIFVYGISVGSFVFKQLRASNMSRFFYCTKDHTSSTSNKPNTLEGSTYWTQDFLWRPAYSSKATFAAINDKLKMGEGSDYVANLAINSLPMQLNLVFDNKTDKEARAIVHYLQENFFPYESIFALDYKGNRLLSSDVGAFSFKYTYPYREDLKFTCTTFGHTKKYRNNNQVQATFVCNTESTLRNVESHAGYATRLDALIPIFIDEETTFQKGGTYRAKHLFLGDGWRRRRRRRRRAAAEAEAHHLHQERSFLLACSSYPDTRKTHLRI